MADLIEQLKKIKTFFVSDYGYGQATTVGEAIATITALRDRVAEVEREREALRAAAIDAEQRCADLIDQSKSDWVKHGATEIAKGQWKASAEAAEARATAAEAAIARLRDEVAEALRGLTEEYAALAEGRKSRYVSPNGICAYDNAIAALRALKSNQGQAR